MDNKKLMGKENNLTKSMGIKDYFMLGFGSMVGVGWAVSLNSWFTTGGGVLAAILGFANPAEVSLATKCAPSVAAVMKMIDDLDAATEKIAA